jgi:hypothetical protein
MDDATDDNTDKLEAEAVRRAVEGDEEAVYYQGKIVGYVKRKSDVMLIFLLKGRRPQVWRDRFDMEAFLKAIRKHERSLPGEA